MLACDRTGSTTTFFRQILDSGPSTTPKCKLRVKADQFRPRTATSRDMASRDRRRGRASRVWVEFAYGSAGSRQCRSGGRFRNGGRRGGDGREQPGCSASPQNDGRGGRRGDPGSCRERGDSCRYRTLGRIRQHSQLLGAPRLIGSGPEHSYCPVPGQSKRFACDRVSDAGRSQRKRTEMPASPTLAHLLLLLRLPTSRSTHSTSSAAIPDCRAFFWRSALRWPFSCRLQNEVSNTIC